MVSIIFNNMKISILLLKALATTSMIQDMNQDKIDNAIKMYWDACKYPRKKKKQIRKEAQKEYSFWVSLRNDINYFSII